MATAKKFYRLNTFDNSIDVEDYDYDYDEYYQESSRSILDAKSQSRTDPGSKNVKYVLKQAVNQNGPRGQDYYDVNYLNYDENESGESGNAGKKYYLIDGKYYTNKPPKSKANKALLAPSHFFNDYSYKMRPDNVKKSPLYVYNRNSGATKNNLEIFPSSGIHSDYDKPRERVYQPVNSNISNLGFFLKE